MSQEFLAQLLKSDNRVTSDPGQSCHVCLQDCGIMSVGTGVIECPIRLPCSHVIGSACIAKWLSTHNTCPICRHKFFPPQPRQSDWDSDDEDEGGEVDEEAVRSIVNICTEIRGELQCSPSMRGIVEQMAINVHSVNVSEGHTLRCAVAVAVHMVSLIMDEVQSLDEISRVLSIATLHIQEAYRLIYSRRERLITSALPAQLIRSSGITSRFLALLPAPTPENGYPVEGVEMRLFENVKMNLSAGQRNDNETRGEGLIPSENFCETFCVELGYDGYVFGICQRIGDILYGSCLQDRRYPRRTIAVSIFIASHLAGFHCSVDFKTSVETVCNVVGVSEAALRQDYAIVYKWRGEIIDADMLERIGRIDIKRALQAVPPLNWPAP